MARKSEEDTDSQVLLSLPRLKTGERRTAYVNCFVADSIATAVGKRGWDIQDIRLMPADSEIERSQVVKATIDGVRMGTIELSQMQLRLLELEARITGLLAIKETPTEEGPKVDSADLASLLRFGSNRVLKLSESPAEAKVAKETKLREPDSVKRGKQLLKNKKNPRLLKDPS